MPCTAPSRLNFKPFHDCRASISSSVLNYSIVTAGLPFSGDFCGWQPDTRHTVRFQGEEHAMWCQGETQYGFNVLQCAVNMSIWLQCSVKVRHSMALMCCQYVNMAAMRCQAKQGPAQQNIAEHQSTKMDNKLQSRSHSPNLLCSLHHCWLGCSFGTEGTRCFMAREVALCSLQDNVHGHVQRIST
eukprot:1153004-Pelagomonas_calceolata.AAC.2